MSVKKPTASCPNCGAPIKSLPTYGHSQWCEYCGTLVDMTPFMPKPGVSGSSKKMQPTEVRVEKHVVYVPSTPPAPSRQTQSDQWIKKDKDGHIPPEEWWKIAVCALILVSVFVWAVTALLF